MQAKHTNTHKGHDVKAFHVYTLDPRVVPDVFKSKEERDEWTEAHYDLQQWQKHFKVTVGQRTVRQEKARAIIWCVTLTGQPG